MDDSNLTQDPQESRRLFLALPLPPSVKEAIEQWKGQHYHRKEGRIRWVPPENWHITACFIGETDRSVSKDILPTVQKALAGISPFSLSFARFQPFPPKKPRMIWGRYEASEGFSALYFRLNRLFYRESEIRQEPIPHVTLARIRKGPKLKHKPPVPDATKDELAVEVDRVALWESELHLKGAVYRKLGEVLLGGLGAMGTG